jgi:hypothetical protein
MAVQPQTALPPVSLYFTYPQSSMVVDITAGTQREQDVSRASGRGGKCHISDDSNVSMMDDS